jgi:hypothetical protein
MGVNGNYDIRTTSPRRNRRRRLFVGLAVAPAVAALLAACGSEATETADTVAPTTIPVTSVPGTTVPDTATPDTTTPDTTAPGTSVADQIEHPMTADSVIVRVAYEGGFVPPGVNFAQLPILLIAGDGNVYTEGVTTEEFPGPLLRPIQVRQLSEAGIQRLLSLAQEAGLLDTPPDYSGADNVADAPETVVEINAAGGGFVHRAYALGIDADKDSSEARRKLNEFVEKLGSLEEVVGEDELGEESLFEPTEYRFQSLPIAEADVDGLDPEPTIVNWPDAAGVTLRDSTECAVLPAETIGAFFEELKQNTVLHEGDGETASFYQLAAAAVLPGDAGC